MPTSPVQYTLSIDGNTSGPFSEEQLRAMLAAGEIAAEHHAWAEGMADWTPLGTLFAPPAPAPVTYHVSDKGHTHGPHPLGVLQTLVKIHRISPEAMVWAEGFADWVPVGTIVEMPVALAPGAPRAAIPVAGGMRPVRATAQPGIKPRPVTAVVRPVSVRAAGTVAVRPGVRATGVRAVAVGQKPAVLATCWARLGAYLLDMLVSVASIAPAPLLMATGRDLTVSLAVGGLIALSVAVYQTVILSTTGQTLGKKWVGIRIVMVAGHANPGFVHAFLLRVLVGQVLFSPIGLIDVCFIFTAERRCIHDMVAGTKVINA